MRNPLGWIITVSTAALLGLGVVLGAGALLHINPYAFVNRLGGPYISGSKVGPNFPGGWMGPGGMMNPGYSFRNPPGARISVDQAIQQAQAYVSDFGTGLQVSEVMEFSENFYVVVKETSTGRGAMELLVDPYTGAVFPEYGPNMMWNSKYSPMGAMGRMMGGITGGDNTLSIDQAIQDGQKYLDVNMAGAKLETDGIAFYGHYTFDYTVDGKTAGMLSVNGITGNVWLHTWHGSFIQETEVK
ncbi:MAG: PepSY domain-containing protein [Chloroflexi bacterium]|nr:PepSY domain-containing protein [Chloroflexota bacterium]